MARRKYFQNGKNKANKVLRTSLCDAAMM